MQSDDDDDIYHGRIDRGEIISFNPIQSDTTHIERGICVRRDEANIPKIFIGGYIEDPEIKSSYKARVDHIDLSMSQFQYIIDSKERIIMQLSRGKVYAPSPLGENSPIFFQVTLYNGRMFVQLRRWIMGRPKRQGVALTLAEFLRLLDLESEIKHRFERLLCEAPMEVLQVDVYGEKINPSDETLEEYQSRCEPEDLDYTDG
jgi:hypothetical protein